eukprot:571048-Amphidinium_carterae.1
MGKQERASASRIDRQFAQMAQMSTGRAVAEMMLLGLRSQQDGEGIRLLGCAPVLDELTSKK